MRVAAFRSGIPALFSSSSSPLLIPSPFIRPPPHTFFPTPHPSAPPPPFLRSAPFHRRLSSTTPMATPAAPSDSAAIAASNKNGSGASIEKQFEGFRAQLEDSGAVRDRIRAVVAEMESAVRLMQSSVLLVHQSLPIQQVLEKARVQIEALKELFKKLADILRECPGQYYRYHGDWRSETQNAVSLIAFLHWLETGSLLMHPEAEEKLGLNSSEFSLDIEDYLVGLCFMSNDFPRYVVNRVTAGDYDCPRKVLTFLTDLHASFRMLNLRNDFLRKKFDSMKYDLRRVEEVFYDVKIRSLAPADSIQDQSTQG